MDLDDLRETVTDGVRAGITQYQRNRPFAGLIGTEMIVLGAFFGAYYMSWYVFFLLPLGLFFLHRMFWLFRILYDIAIGLLAFFCVAGITGWIFPTWLVFIFASFAFIFVIFAHMASSQEIDDSRF